MSSNNKAKAQEYRQRPDVKLRRQMNRSMPSETNMERKARAKLKRRLRKGYGYT